MILKKLSNDSSVVTYSNVITTITKDNFREVKYIIDYTNIVSKTNKSIHFKH